MPVVAAPLSVVIPVLNGARWIESTLAAIEAQRYPAPREIVVVDDGSTDGSRELVERARSDGRLRLGDGPRRGAAAALNAGIRAATYELIAQIDQDVVIHEGWLERLAAALEDEGVAAAQGHYVTPKNAGLWARVMGLDLAQRYRALGDFTNHVCTGNTVYRKSALTGVGLFDEALGYGYDNDISYRLVEAGHRLAFRPGATSAHHWRDDCSGYVRQQYGFGYGRLDLVARHRRRAGGDNVSRVAMMLHAPAMLLALGAAAIALAGAFAGRPVGPAAWIALGIAGLLAGERLVAGARAALVFRDPAALLFPIVHLIRDAAWAAAIVVWTGRRLGGIVSRPAHSMAPARRLSLFE